MKILNFGSCNMDSVYKVSHITRPGETNTAKSVAQFPGGKGLNQSIALARAGAKVFHAGCIGEDGRFLADTMQSCGIDLRYLKTVADSTGHAIIQVDSSAENSIIIYRGANGWVTREHIDSVLADFEAGDFLLTQNEISNIDYLIRRAAEKGMTVVFNPSPYDDSLKNIDLNHIRWLILNETEAAAMFDSQVPEVIQNRIQSQYPDLKVVLTLGKNGSVYIDRERIHSQSAYRVDSVDTTAAGDTYTGYLIACIAANNKVEQAMRFASAASALAVSRKGAASSIPTHPEVKAILPQLQPVSGNLSQKRKTIVEHFMEEHACDGTLQMLASELGCTPSYTSTWLKSELGCTFTELLQRRKCEACAILLETTELSITEIISQIGYRNESHFRRIFTEMYGVSPLKYRKRMVKNHEK